MSDKLCDEFVKWANHFEWRLAFAVWDTRRVEDLWTFWRVACFSASFEYGLETAGLFCALASLGGGEGALFSVS